MNTTTSTLSTLDITTNDTSPQHTGTPSQNHRSSSSTFSLSTTTSYSFSRVLLAGGGFLADAYDFFVINIAVDIMAQAQLQSQQSQSGHGDLYSQPLTTHTTAAIKSAALAGAVLGQLLFGAAADKIGRKRVFLATALLVGLGALGSACVANKGLAIDELNPFLWGHRHGNAAGVGTAGELGVFS
eukprot:CAMPEP_0181288890 /NCGR_PEP_ID=MMETSP1101-20121128/586_1 /TAXON_ID=46948 /ORGANISM="Rhodomonas abbreviata, Strain Caron Lab Isolate" /LENGTH=184 /DNA_ID=CAMNT_0023393067 /DNA_START=45 /DNA_END=596 /DNA_ORIENTATION=+